MTIDLSGEWIFDGHPWDLPYAGRVRMQLQQVGTTLSGELVQLIDPFSGQAPPNPDATKATVAGELLEDTQSGNCLVILKRLNQHDTFRAVFVGVLSDAHDSISGTFANTVRKGGSFVMVKQS